MTELLVSISGTTREVSNLLLTIYNGAVPNPIVKYPSPCYPICSSALCIVLVTGTLKIITTYSCTLHHTPANLLDVVSAWMDYPLSGERGVRRGGNDD